MTRPWTGSLLLATLLALMLGWVQAWAHDSRPLYVEVEQLGERLYLLAWKIPSSVATTDIPALRLVPNCVAMQEQTVSDKVPSRYANQLMFRCDQGAGPESVIIEYPQANPSLSTIVRIQRLVDSKERASKERDSKEGASKDAAAVEIIHAPPAIGKIELSGAVTVGSVIWQYLGLGVRHIVGGYDHLMFVTCLVLLAGTWRRVVWAVTGFTVAHSVTLALSALGLWRVPPVAVEATIALSIVFLAWELCRGRQDSLAWRYPGAIAMGFGLLHGFGFASVLRDIGLPPGETFTALFAFNLGVEVGQLGFVGLVLLAIAGYYSLTNSNRVELLNSSALRLMVYPIGILASFWFWERLYGFTA